MVQILVKRLPREEYSKDYDEFLYTVPNTSNVGEVTDAVTRIQNFRVRMKWMVSAAKELAKDVPEDQQHILLGPADEGARYLDLSRVSEWKLDSKEEELQLLSDTLKGATMMLFPDLCSGSDVLQRLASMLDDERTEDSQRTRIHRVLSMIDDKATTEDILTGTTVMWWTGKPLDRNEQLLKYSGKNDKTKLIVKVTREGGVAPQRESGLDHRTQSEMMAYWYKKQEEQKQLVEDDDISYTNSEWANPRGLKQQFLGMQDIKVRPK